MRIPNYDSPAMDGHRPSTPEEEQRGYVLKPWNGYDRWACTRCPLECPDEGSAGLHFASVHLLQDAQERMTTAVRPVEARLFDASGKPVTQIEVPKEAPAPVETPKVSDYQFGELAEMLERLEKEGAIEYGAHDDSKDG